MSEKISQSESFLNKLARLWPVYLMESVLWFIILAILYLLIFA